jgi:putative lipoic acid-binding regulatory protein
MLYHPLSPYRFVVLLAVSYLTSEIQFRRTVAWTVLCSMRAFKKGVHQIQNAREVKSSLDAKAGSFFNPVPEPQNDGPNSDLPSDELSKPSKAILPSTINGIPSKEVGIDIGMSITASIRKDPVSSKPYVGIGPSSFNDVTKPEYDDQGYTLYADERTGTKARVFEALVEYPCLFTLKIVGANEGTFVQDVLTIVATTCLFDSTASSLDHSIKYNGKWASITVQAPVQSAQMLYQLYEDIDRDPRVKFKF